MALSNLAARTLSAAILIPLALAAIYFGGIAFKLLVAIVTIASALEFKNIVLGKLSKNKHKQKFGWFFFGFFYLTIPAFSLIYLRDIDPLVGFIGTLWLFLVVWGTDIGGYIFGRLIGGPKLIPAISPKKTWSGLIGSILLAVVVSYGFGRVYIEDPEARKFLLLFAAILAVVAQAGDLFESWIKRRFEVKDSGSIIPGHGGVLDRIDGLLFAAPVVALFIYLHLNAVT